MTHDQMLAYVGAVAELENWAQALADMQAKRDEMIKFGHRAGLSNTEIAKRMKISRTTVVAVLGLSTEEMEIIAREGLPLYDPSVSGPGKAILELVKPYSPQDAARIIARINELAGA